MIHIVEHDDLCSGIEGLLHLFEGLGLYLYFSYKRSIFTGELHCPRDGACCSDMIVLYQNSVCQIVSVIGGSANLYRIFFKNTVIRRGLSRIEKLRLRALEKRYHMMGHRGNTAHSLKIVKRRSLTYEQSLYISKNLCDLLALMDLLAILYEYLELRRIIEQSKYSLEHIESAEDSILLCDQVYLSRTVLRHDGIRRHILTSDIFSQRRQYIRIRIKLKCNISHYL